MSKDLQNRDEEQSSAQSDQGPGSLGSQIRQVYAAIDHKTLPDALELRIRAREARPNRHNHRSLRGEALLIYQETQNIARASQHPGTFEPPLQRPTQ
jgi:hypothetical protein